MKHAIVFDIETKNIFSDTNGRDPRDLDISVLCTYEYDSDEYKCYFEEDFGKLWPILEKASTLIGYNSDYFDIPVLNKYYQGDLSHLKSIDILKYIKDSLGRRVSLDQVAEATLGKKKSGHGLEAIEWWRNGKLDLLQKYCRDDVQITKEIFDYALLNKKIKFKEAGQVFDIPINTKDWKSGEKAAITYSLPF